MANELELLTINAALDSWVDEVPGAISTGYQAQNTNIEGRTNGLESLYIEISGTDAVFNPSGVIDDNGAPMVVKTQVTLAVPSGQRFVRVIDGVDPTKRSLQLESSLGVYDESKNGYYTSGDRMLNWSLNDISGSLKSYKILAPLHAHILGDALFDGNITQTSGVTSLKATTIDGNLELGTTTLGVSGRASILGGNNASASLWFGDVDNASVGQIRYVNSTNQMRFYTSGIQRLTITSDGRIFTGLIDNTIDDLQVAGSIYASTNIQALSTLYAGSLGATRTQINPTSIIVGTNERTADGSSNIDMYADTSGVYSSRVIRQGTVNGEFQIIQRGTGELHLRSINNGTIAIKGSDNYATFSNTLIELKKNTEITGFLNTSSYGLFGGAIYDTINNLNVLGDGILSGALTLGTYLKSNFLTGGTSETDGANIILKAADDVGAPSTIVFRKGTTEYGRFNGADSSLSLNGALNLANAINPTTAPPESTIEITSITSINVPRGHYSIELEIQIIVSGGTNPEAYIEQFINGIWYSVSSITGVGLVGTYKSFSGVGFRSSGTDLRLRNPSGNGSYFVRANLRKY